VYETERRGNMLSHVKAEYRKRESTNEFHEFWKTWLNAASDSTRVGVARDAEPSCLQFAITHLILLLCTYEYVVS